MGSRGNLLTINFIMASSPVDVIWHSEHPSSFKVTIVARSNSEEVVFLFNFDDYS